MARSLIRTIRLGWWLGTLSVRSLLSYPPDFLIGALGVLMFHLTNLAAVYLVFDLAGSIGGWTPQQAVFLAALSNMRFVLGGIFFGGLHSLPPYIRSGKLDRILTYPVSPLFTLLCLEKDVADLVNVGVLAAALAWSARSFGDVTLVNVAFFVVLMALGLAATFGFSLLTVAPSFWATAGNAFPQIFRLFWEFEAYPTRLFPSAIQFLLTWVFPVAVAVFVPSQVLFGHEPWMAGIRVVGLVAAIDLALGLGLFHLGLRRYQSVGH